MSMPAITKTWTHVTNQRIAFVSVLLTVAALLYGVFSAQLIGVGAFTCVGSSTGVTGTGNLSGTNTWASAANCAVRGASAVAIQSWIVIRDGNGWDWLICYQGAADNNIKVSVSRGQLWTLNGTNPAFQPTATDECPIATNAFDYALVTASADRVWNLSYSSDKKIWRTWVYRSSAMLSFLAGEQVNSLANIYSNDPVVFGFASTNTGSGHHAAGGALGTAATNNQASSRTAATNFVAGGSGEGFYGSHSPTVFTIEKPDTHGASPVVPVGIAGTTTVNFRGKWGNRIDVWASYQNVNDQNADTYASATYTGMGCTGVYPWDGSAKAIA